MNKRIYTTILGTGSYLPTQAIPNSSFLDNEFYDLDGKKINLPTAEIIAKFESITGIKERRFVTDDLCASDIGYFAAADALESTGIDPESLDYIICAHNFADVKASNKIIDLVPSLAARIKNKLKIKNPSCIAYDTIFGCPGWVQAMIQADYYLRSGDAKRIMIVGCDTLSRISDPHDRDTMIFADGAGCAILEAKESETPIGLISHVSQSDAYGYSELLNMGGSIHEGYEGNEIFIKMNGRKLYVYALNNVPGVVKRSLEKAGLTLKDIKKVLIHQANEKMDDAIMERLFHLYGETTVPKEVVPMTIHSLGNSAVATIPTMLDLIMKGKMNGHHFNSGDYIVFTSVGAGMNINSVVYKFE
jgi:3-oxoacyl-[acyl-carrier-protein] synthase III